jgi:hypothetical protein
MSVEQIFKEAKLYTDGKLYTLLRLHPGAITVGASVIAELAEPFSFLIVDKDEITVLIPSDALESFESRLRDCQVAQMQYRLITFDIALDLSLVGFMAYVSQVLAQGGVTIMPYAAYTRDHLLVPSDQFDKAWATLEKLKARN